MAHSTPQGGGIANPTAAGVVMGVILCRSMRVDPLGSSSFVAQGLTFARYLLMDSILKSML